VSLQQLPRLDPIEELKQDRPKEQCSVILWAILLYLLDEKLTDAIRSAVRIRETETLQNAILRPWWRGPHCTRKEDALAFRRKPPEGLKNLRCRKPSTGDDDQAWHHWCWWCFLD
jgi:hypothetical protein